MKEHKGVTMDKVPFDDVMGGWQTQVSSLSYMNVKDLLEAGFTRRLVNVSFVS